MFTALTASTIKIKTKKVYLTQEKFKYKHNFRMVKI